MAATSDDDVPTGATATSRDESPDGDTTAAATAPATTVPSVVPDDEDEDDRTVQQQLDPALKHSVRSSAAPRSATPATPRAPSPIPARPSPPAPPIRMTSKRPTAVGLGSPVPITRPAAGYDPAPSTTPAPPPVVPALAPAPSKVGPRVPAPRSAASPGDDDDSVETIQTEADADDGSITTTAPAPHLSVKAASLPLTVPGTVQIRELPSVDDDEALDETEVRTVVSGLTKEEPVSTAPIPAAGRPSDPPPTEADEVDDSVTTQAPSAVRNARLPEHDDEPKTSPPARLSPVAKPIPAAGRRPGEDPPFPVTDATTRDDESDAYDADESVTTRGPAVLEYEDDSVTAQAPVARPPAPHTPLALGVPPTLDDITDGTTKKVAKRAQLPVPAPVAASADVQSSQELEDAESITTQAPGHLTNMLRVIATPETLDDDNDDAAENKTAVMLGAPVKPVGAPSAGSLRAARPIITGSAGPSGARAAAIADLREPTSDSGLRIARAEVPSGDHASLSALMPGLVPQTSEHGSGAQSAQPNLRSVRDASPAAFANTEQAFHPPAQRGRQPSLREFDFGSTTKKPRYGLLVGLVAVLSFTIPLVLFLWLHQGMVDDTPPRTASEVAPDLVARGDSTRPRATKGAPASSSASSAPPPTSNGPSRPPPWFPRRR